MPFDYPVVDCEVEYKYRRGVPGRRGGAVTTLRVRVDGKLDNKVAKSVLEQAKAMGWPDVVDDICVVGSQAKLSPGDTWDRLEPILQQLIEEQKREG